MRVIPALDVMGGKCVQLVGGRPGTEQVEIDDVIGVARRWQSEGADMLHIIDLDRALGSGSNESLVEKLLGDVDIPVQVGGGIRTPAQVQRLFDLGSEKVIVGTRAVQDKSFLEALANEYRDGIVVALDSVDGEVMIRGWQEGSGRALLDTAEELDQIPFWGYLFTNIAVEGRLQGIDSRPVEELVKITRKPVMVAGGITTMADLTQLRRMGVESAVVGMAIYTGQIDFKKAVRELR